MPASRSGIGRSCRTISTRAISDYARAEASIGINGVVLNNVDAQADDPDAALHREGRGPRRTSSAPMASRSISPRDSRAPIEIGGLKTRRSARSRRESLVEGEGGRDLSRRSPISAASWSRPIRKASPARRTIVAPTPTAPTCWPTRWRRITASSCGGLSSTRRRTPTTAPSRPTTSSCRSTAKFRRQRASSRSRTGRIDFQPREPFQSAVRRHAARRRVMLEVQITKEYLGSRHHLAYLGPLCEEVLRADTYAKGPGSTVAKVIDGSLDGHAETGMAGVANIGTDRDWCGSEFNQANWYAFGRLAWDPDLSARAIAGRMGAHDLHRTIPAFVEPAVDMMMGSREAVVDYMTPLGLHHQMATRPSLRSRAVGQRRRAAAIGIRPTTIAPTRTASASTAPPPAAMPSRNMRRRVARRVRGPRRRCRTNILLWFHHVPWDYRMKLGPYAVGRTRRRTTRKASKPWRRTAPSGTTLKPYVDAPALRRDGRLSRIEEKEARWWRDADIAYFQSVNEPAAAAGRRAARASAGLLQKPRIPLCPWPLTGTKAVMRGSVEGRRI